MIPVLWSAQSDDVPCKYNCNTMLLEMLELYDVQHFAAEKKFYDEFDGCVLIVHGGRQMGSIHRVNMTLDHMEWAVVIVLGDEECSFPVEQIQHPCCKIWIQEPIPERHSFCDRFLLDGYTPHTKSRIVQVEKDLDWSFAGQDTNARRRACVDELRGLDWGGVMVLSKGYCQGVSLDEYYNLMCRSHIVPCPSGPCSPDSARVCEALECGAVPILDDLSPTRHEPGFWKIVLGNHPFPVLTDYRELPRIIKETKADWVRINAECQNFWVRYQTQFNQWLKWDIEELTGVSPCMKT